MNFEKIEQVIKLVKENEVKKFSYKDSKSEISIDFTEGKANSNTSNQNLQAVSKQEAKSAENELNLKSAEDSNLQEVKSPMVGTFFLQDENELTNPLINVGDKVNKGDTIGYIEAMKVMNEVKTEVEGVIQEILIEHGTSVEYNQTIVKIK
ncbi:MAG TPA: biotin/lipoyl-containing protein [Staphylococcus sp.]|nr:biotin/lipoyl-containing protein [Staphylococcus sp.]